MSSFRPGELWPDDRGVHINAHGGGVLLHEGTYFWFGEHKIEGRIGNSAQVGVHVYASTDLAHWKDEGVALAVSDDPDSEIARGCVLERPKVIYNPLTRQFVMWFHLELKGQGYKAARCALAVSDSVTGPYLYVRSHRPNRNVWPVNVTEADQTETDSESLLTGPAAAQSGQFLRRDFPTGQMARDMTLFVDDDGTAYLVAAAEENLTLGIHQLTPDFQDFTGRWLRLFPGGWNEAPALFRRGGQLYMITSGCTGWDPNPARSAVAPSIWGPWTELGNPCRGTEDEDATTFWSQSTHVLPAPGQSDAFIYMGDRWRPRNPIDGRYVWLPLEWEGERPVLRWHDEWDLSFFAAPGA